MTNQPLTKDSLVYCKPLPYADDEQVGMENLSQWIHKDNIRSAVDGLREQLLILSGYEASQENRPAEYAVDRCIDMLDKWFPVFEDSDNGSYQNKGAE